MSLKTIYFSSALLLLGFLQIGCASKGFNRGSLQEMLRGDQPKYDDKEIKEAFNKKPNLKKPFRLGIYFKSSPKSTWRWTEQDKAIFDELTNELKNNGTLSTVFPIMDSLVNEDSLKGIRLVAAKHQADAVLIISGATEVDRYINSWGWTYILILPTLFVPGSEVDTLFMAQASLWDVRNEYLYLTAESEVTTKKTYVAAFGKSNKDLITQTKTGSLNKLKDELKKMIKGTKL